MKFDASNSTLRVLDGSTVGIVVLRAAKSQGLKLTGVRANFNKACATMSPRLRIRVIRVKSNVCEREMSKEKR